MKKKSLLKKSMKQDSKEMFLLSRANMWLDLILLDAFMMELIGLHTKMMKEVNMKI